MILKDASGKVVYAENISLKALATFLDPEKGASSIRFFPNPATDVLNIQYCGSLQKEMLVEIYDASGRRISLQEFYNVESGQQISMDINSLQKGIYLCRMISGKRIIGIKKFIK